MWKSCISLGSIVGQQREISVCTKVIPNPFQKVQYQFIRNISCGNGNTLRLVKLAGSNHSGSGISLKSLRSAQYQHRDNTSFCIGNRYFLIDQTNKFSTSSIACGAREDKEAEQLSLGKNKYEQIAEDTLESLTSYFDEILEATSIDDSDVSYGSGVLTIKLGAHGTYVINKQTPNRQIWLSSPSSGPKRYDFIDNTWIYKHDGMSLYHLLNSEIPNILGKPEIDFQKNCTYGIAK